MNVKFPSYEYPMKFPSTKICLLLFVHQCCCLFYIQVLQVFSAKNKSGPILFMNRSLSLVYILFPVNNTPQFCVSRSFKCCFFPLKCLITLNTLLHVPNLSESSNIGFFSFNDLQQPPFHFKHCFIIIDLSIYPIKTYIS